MLRVGCSNIFYQVPLVCETTKMASKVQSVGVARSLDQSGVQERPSNLSPRYCILTIPSDSLHSSHRAPSPQSYRHDEVRYQRRGLNLAPLTFEQVLVDLATDLFFYFEALIAARQSPVSRCCSLVSHSVLYM